MAIVSRDQILGFVPRTAIVDVPEWGEDAQVEVTELTLAQQNAIAISAKGRPDQDAQATIKTFLEGVTNPRMQAGDYDALLARGAAGVSRVVGRIVQLSGMTPAQQAEIMGKSPTTP